MYLCVYECVCSCICVCVFVYLCVYVCEQVTDLEMTGSFWVGYSSWSIGATSLGMLTLGNKVHMHYTKSKEIQESNVSFHFTFG